MTVLLLRLAGPLQAWGDSSRFVRRDTRREPTKSGVLGLLAAAQGRRRTDPIEDLLELEFGVRVDQPGEIVRDFQTAIRWSATPPVSMPLSYRYYLSDAVFVAAVSGDDSLIAGLQAAVRRPAFPLFLGRRACPPSTPVDMGVHEGDLEEVLRSADWQASTPHRRRSGNPVFLEIVKDAVGGGPDEVVRDVPQSWDPQRREYGWRGVTRCAPVSMPNPEGRRDIDFFSAVVGT